MSGKPPRLEGVLAYFLSARGIVHFWLLYGIAHAFLRLNISRTLSLDDSRASELVQEFALGYQARQPPLYEWILWSAQQAFGTGIESHLVVRYSLILALGLSCFGAVRAAIKSERWAAAASLSLAASYPVGWTFHEWATQTILLCIACFATLHAMLNWLERPSGRAAFWLGAAIGLGLLSKFSYPLFLAGLLIACISLREGRRLLDMRLLVSVAVAFLMISPYLLWLYEVHGDVASAIEHTMIVQEKPYLWRVIIGLAQLAKSIPLFLLPWLALVALLAPRAFGYGRAVVVPATLAERLTLRTMLAAAVLAAIGIAAIGATNVAERYMHPILMVAPVYVFARIARFYTNESPLRPLALLGIIAALVIFCIRFIAVTDNGITKRADRLSQIPYESLAMALKAHGIGRGTAVTFDVRDAGNLRAFLPDLRVTARDSFRLVKPPRRAGDDGSCVLIYSHATPEELAPFNPSPPDRIDAFGRFSKLGAARRGAWFVSRLDPNTPACK